MSNQEDSKPSTRRGFMGAMTALTAASYNRVRGANDRVTSKYRAGPLGTGSRPRSDLLVFDWVVAEVDNHRMEAPLEPDEECVQVALGWPC